MMTADLRVVKGKKPGERFPLEKEKILLGRNPDCDLVLEEGAVSRRHARLRLVDGQWYLDDLKSRNGTFLNGVRVQGSVEISDGAMIRICDLVFGFEQGGLGHPEDGSVGSQRKALLVDDEPVEERSAIMSQVDLAKERSVRVPWTVRPETKLRALLEIGHHLGRAIGPKEVLPKLIESLFTVFPQADRGFIVLEDPETKRLRPMVVKDRKGKVGETVRISRTIVREVMNTKKAILSADAATDSRFDSAQSVVDFRIRSMICAPLIGIEGNVLGVIQIDTVHHRGRFNEEDLDVLASVAGQVAYTVENALMHQEVLKKRAFDQELAIAHEVQQGFLPAHAPEVDGFRFFDYYEPANQLGGDYYDYVPLPDGRLAVVLADVSGKGISAALLAARLSAEIRYQLAGGLALPEAMGEINRVFCEPHWDDRFITMVVGLLDPTRHEIRLTNAGHLPPLKRTKSLKIEPVGLDISSLPLGVTEETKYSETIFTLARGESLTFYSDGITEAMNHKGKQFGSKRLNKALKTDALDLIFLGEGLLDRVKDFVGRQPQSDDMCLVMMARKENF